MPEQPRALKFRNPPVVEKVLGAFFEPLHQLGAGQLGRAWYQLFGKEYPSVEDRAPVDEPVETVSHHAFIMGWPRVLLEVRETFTPRLWAANERRDEVVQLQRDAFFFNWLWRDRAAKYRPYEQHRKEFLNKLQALADHVRLARLGEIRPTWAVVTYVNHIDCGPGRDPLEVLQETLRFCSDFRDGCCGVRPDSTRLDVSYPIPGRRGRVHVTVTPTYQREAAGVVWRVELTGNSYLDERSLDYAARELDAVHDHLVRVFLSITSETAQQSWGPAG